MLKGQAGGQGQGLLLSIRAAQITVQGQHTFFVDGARHFCFPLDVDDAAFAHEGARRDAPRLAKAVIANIHHRQPIHLPDDCATGGDEQRAFQNFFLDDFLDAVRTVDALVEGLLDICAGDDDTAVNPRPIACFPNQVCNRAKPGRQLSLLADQPRTKLDHFGNGRAVKMAQLFLMAACGDKMRVFLHIVQITQHRGIKIRPHLKQIRKILVLLVHQVIHIHAAHQDDFHLQRNRFRHQRLSQYARVVHGGIRHNLDFLPA